MRLAVAVWKNDTPKIVGALQNGDQRVSQLAVDDRQITCKIRREQEVGFGRSVIMKNVEQRLPSPLRPVPRSSVLNVLEFIIPSSLSD